MVVSPIAKWTNFRTNLYDKVTTGLHCGINLRMMRYSDVLLRAAECENEVNGPTQQAIDWINRVRERASSRILTSLISIPRISSSSRLPM